jgi:hypothetical protein
MKRKYSEILRHEPGVHDKIMRTLQREVENRVTTNNLQ